MVSRVETRAAGPTTPERRSGHFGYGIAEPRRESGVPNRPCSAPRITLTLGVVGQVPGHVHRFFIPIAEDCAVAEGWLR
jgi:hypothetical protein